MAFLDRVRDLFLPPVVREAADFTARVQPPLRRDAGPVLIGDAMTVPAVYRALQLLTTAAAQLPLVVERQGKTLTGPDVPPLVRRPSLDMSRSDWIEQVVMSLAVAGNAFLHKETAPSSREILTLAVWNPHDVGVWRDHKSGRVRYTYRGRDYDRADVAHLHLQRIPGSLRGLGPIQAAQQTMRGTVDLREHMSRWFTDSGQPTGILTSDQVLSSDDARRARNAWNGLDGDGNPLDQAENPSGVKVLGKGTTYSPILLNPKDALWLDAQAFSTLEIARLFGVPSSLMLAAVEGNSQTYSNVEQEWIAFVRFGLMTYLRKIEEALTEMSPAGQKVRFNLEGLLRSDTKTRYQAHALAIGNGFMTDDEVRAIEGLPPLTAAQRRLIAENRPAATPSASQEIMQ